MKITLHATPPRPCSYLSDRQSSSLFVDPASLDNRLYSHLIQKGFRRSGEHIYRPSCQACDDCIPLRVSVKEFTPNRIQRRVRRRNRDVTVITHPPRYDETHFSLYRRYLHSRHRGGEMDNPTPDDYLCFLTSHWSDTRFHEFRADDQLFAIAVADRVDTGLSAVYTFFDPAQGGRSPGVYAILWLIEETRRLGLPWLYLGYWIPGCRKMAYKNQYRPFELYRNGDWQRE